MPEDYYSNLNNVVLTSNSSVYNTSTATTITIDPSVYASGTVPTSAISGTISVGGITNSASINTTTSWSYDYTTGYREEWINSWPEWNKFQSMCEEYPGLKKAYDNLVVSYKMVKDDYENQKSNS